MATEIKLSELGENLEGGEVLDVKVAEGDTVNVGQSLLEVEAEKSTVEVPAPQAGKIAKLLVKKGDQIKVGQTLCLIEGGGTAKSREAPAKHTSPPVEPEPPHAFASEGGDEAGSEADEADAAVPEKPRPVQRPRSSPR